MQFMNLTLWQVCHSCCKREDYAHNLRKSIKMIYSTHKYVASTLRDCERCDVCKHLLGYT